MGILLNILVFVFVMGVIVIVHEMGHLIAAKSFSVLQGICGGNGS